MQETPNRHLRRHRRRPLRRSPTATPTATPRPTPTPTPFPTATPTPRPTPTPSPTSTPQPTPTLSLSQLIGNVAPAVVQIFTPGGAGSGFVVQSGGWVITNAHVINGHREVTVVVNESTRLPGEVVGWEEHWLVDLAVVKVEIPSGVSPLEFAPTDTVDVGDSVVALGFPLGSVIQAMEEGWVASPKPRPGR